VAALIVASFIEKSCESKVADLDGFAVFGHEYVATGKIPMDYFLTVQVLKALNHHGNK